MRRYALAMMLSCVVLMTLLLSLVVSQSTSGNECCSLKLMDSNERVAIETARSLTTGTFLALRIRLCTTDTTVVQIWTQTANTLQYQLKWQTIIVPTLAQTNLNYAVVNFDANNPLTIAATDRLGIYSNTTNVFSVPYDFNPTSDSLYYTTSHYSAVTSFVPGTTVTVQALNWQRSFANYVVFCAALNCPGFSPENSPGFLAQDSPATATTPSIASQVGAPGPAGPAGSCCTSNQMPSCDPGNTVTSGLQSQSNTIASLQDAVNTMSAQLNNLVSTSIVAGVCPQGFIPGTYGVGACYLPFRIPSTFSSAILNCNQYGASLFEVQSDLEQQFVRSIIGNNTIAGEAVDTYWTGGMYNSLTSSWVWYDTVNSQTEAMNYKKWQNVTVPIPQSSDDICLLYQINFIENTNYWTYGSCYSNSNYYICETPKQCL